MGKWFSEGYQEVEKEAARIKEVMDREWLPTFFLSDGEEAKVTFITVEPVNFYEHFETTLKRSFTCSQDNSCPLCQMGNNPSYRGAYLVIDHRQDEWEDKETGETKKAQYQLKIMKHGVRALQVVMKKHERKGLKKHDWLITRTGTGASSQYDFESCEKESGTPLPKPEDIPEIAEVIKPLPRRTIMDRLRKAGKGVSTGNKEVRDEDDGVIKFGE